MKVSIDKILENMPKNLTDLEKVRYLYLKMGDIFSYNRDFLYIDDYRYVNENDFGDGGKKYVDIRDGI